ncbi:unnamed protein product [Caenorhabditis bovis]|uniref:Peptidase S1 domain-containing protein n=1 Tax=Caenorhabditis bovis TaxID=2654633 RepID=A0A8S1F2I7_9PELO|nr:unnamed protein product [Caenorhabditis bovis]
MCLIRISTFLSLTFLVNCQRLNEEENKLLQNVCGTHMDWSDDVVRKVFNPEPVNLAQAPWTVFLRYSRGTTCSGTLISSRHVITAAHCFFDKKNLQVQFIESRPLNPKKCYNNGVYVPLRTLRGLKLRFGSVCNHADDCSKTGRALNFQVSCNLPQHVWFCIASETKKQLACEGDSGSGVVYKSNSRVYLTGAVSRGIHCRDRLVFDESVLNNVDLVTPIYYHLADICRFSGVCPIEGNVLNVQKKSALDSLNGVKSSIQHNAEKSMIFVALLSYLVLA